MKSTAKGSKKFWNFSPAFLGANLLVALVISLGSFAECIATGEGYRDLTQEILISFVMSSTLSYGGFLMEDYFDRTISWIQYPVKRLILECLCYFLYVFCTSIVIIFLFQFFVTKTFTLNNIPWNRLVSWTGFPMKISFVILFILISRSFLMEWRTAAIESEQLKTERFAQQYQSLKDQLNPHFLFNSLNVLSNLVYENPDTAAKFIRQLSGIYRYVLEVQQEELVTLKQELGFAENFLSLQKIRFEESLKYRIQVDGNAAGSLPPLSLQLLLENAIKHNVASMEMPLRIDIELVNDQLIVKNNLQPKSSLPDDSTGVGLANISKRYALLSEDRISVSNDGGYFVVTLPLLKVQEQVTPAGVKYVYTK
ncbi:sensor histidine kinase [Dyadobacter sp. LJ53]|uniref:sensor histidine kinase n=1 Tax=Dyadobacter chenwenxiniae TaxID=2906456 RepID=UPI001F1C0563|nr:sensor histidine kinase [Dyadobacter chenwenxiniae]MCF0050325.1 sensor histidine kinase [Dyadobacter chenwenxiniae]